MCVQVIVNWLCVNSQLQNDDPVVYTLHEHPHSHIVIIYMYIYIYRLCGVLQICNNFKGAIQRINALLFVAVFFFFCFCSTHFILLEIHERKSRNFGLVFGKRFYGFINTILLFTSMLGRKYVLKWVHVARGFFIFKKGGINIE